MDKAGFLQSFGDMQTLPAKNQGVRVTNRKVAEKPQLLDIKVMMQQSFRCVLCGNIAEGYIEDAGWGWRDEENNKIYLCKEDFITIYKNLRYAWHPLE